MARITIYGLTALEAVACCRYRRNDFDVTCATLLAKWRLVVTLENEPSETFELRPEMMVVYASKGKVGGIS